MQNCTVCAHASVSEINTALIGHVADREVERRFPEITRASISRHRRNHLNVGADDPAADPGLTPEVLPPLPKKGKSANAGDEIDIEAQNATARRKSQRKAIDQQRAVCGATWKLIDKALKKGNLGVATTNLRNMTEAIKALAQHTGELSQPGLAVNVNITGRERWADSSLDVLDRALARWFARKTAFAPEAIETLRQLAAAPCPQCGQIDCSHDLL